MPLNPTDGVAAADKPTATRPMTGAEYLESLRDGREIWLYGEHVKDVTTHPAFRNTARMIARLYDALHDTTLRDVLTTAGHSWHLNRCPATTGRQTSACEASPAVPRAWP